MVYLAGLASEKLLAHRYDWVGADSDVAQSSRLLEELVGSAPGCEKKTRALFRGLLRRAEVKLRQPRNWRAVRAVATELLRHRELGARRLRALITAATPAETLRSARRPTQAPRRI